MAQNNSDFNITALNIQDVNRLGLSYLYWMEDKAKQPWHVNFVVNEIKGKLSSMKAPFQISIYSSLQEPMRIKRIQCWKNRLRPSIMEWIHGLTPFFLINHLFLTLASCQLYGILLPIIYRFNFKLQQFLYLSQKNKHFCSTSSPAKKR